MNEGQLDFRPLTRAERQWLSDMNVGLWNLLGEVLYALQHQPIEKLLNGTLEYR